MDVTTCTKCGIELPVSEFPRDPHRSKLGVIRRCRPCYNAQKRAEHAANPEPRRAKVKAWQKRNPEWRQSQESILRKAKKYRETHLELVREREKAARLRFPEKEQARVGGYWARRRGATLNDFTVEQWVALKEYFNFRCAYCNEPVEVLTQDHIIALSKGGQHTMENIVPACRSCNSRKGNRSLAEMIVATNIAVALKEGT